MPFFDILRLPGDHHCACAQSGVIFHFFQELSNKKIKCSRTKDDQNSLKGGGPALGHLHGKMNFGYVVGFCLLSLVVKVFFCQFAYHQSEKIDF